MAIPDQPVDDPSWLDTLKLCGSLLDGYYRSFINGYTVCVFPSAALAWKSLSDGAIALARS